MKGPHCNEKVAICIEMSAFEPTARATEKEPEFLQEILMTIRVVTVVYALEWLNALAKGICRGQCMCA